MRRRRRKDYTPKQEAARVELHAAETWLQIVAEGIAEALKRERYCGDCMRRIIGHVNGELLSAVVRQENADKAHGDVFGSRRGRVIVPRKNRVPKKTSVPSGTKATAVAPESTNQKGKKKS